MGKHDGQLKLQISPMGGNGNEAAITSLYPKSVLAFFVS